MYVAQLTARGIPVQLICGKRDEVILPPITIRYIDALEKAGLHPEVHWLQCGHYSLGTFPFSAIAFVKALAVIFQEVVHSVWSVNADVAKRQ
jgi:hypothetical protein